MQTVARRADRCVGEEAVQVPPTPNAVDELQLGERRRQPTEQ